MRNSAQRKSQASEPGFDGNPPEFTEARGSEVRDERTGAIIREGEKSQYNSNVDRVSYLFRHKRISQRQFDAAQKLEQDWQIAMIAPTASNVIVGNGASGGATLPADAKVAAMKRHRGATLALGHLWQMIELVVQENMTVEKASARLRWHPQFGMGVLWCGLHVLADHYRIG